MGNKMSSQSGGAVIRGPEQAAADQAAAQLAAPTYHGPLVQHHFINCQVAVRHHISFSFMTNGIVSSNIDAYYPTLAENCSRGLKLLTFYRVPGELHHSTGLFNPDMVAQFQGIFCHYISPQTGQPVNPDATQYQLRIEKSVIQPEYVHTSLWSSNSQVATNTSHLLQTLQSFADAGGRLICIEITGQEAVHHQNSTLFRPAMATLGCDLFFEMPVGPFTEKYVYTCVSVPIVMTKAGALSTRWVASCDWNGTLSNYLGQGWKLVEIFYDKGSYTQHSGFQPVEQLNSQWFFEKPASRINDPTPRYQGTFVEHEILVQYRQTVTNWEPVIQNMGATGWELACILDTPESRLAGTFTNSVRQRTLLFFQRDIMYV